MSFSVAENEVKRMAGAPVAGEYATWSYLESLETRENRRFVAAYEPILGRTRKKPPVPIEKPADLDRESSVPLGRALPSMVRGAEGIPYPTKPVPDEDPDADPSKASGTSDT